MVEQWDFKQEYKGS